jgi:hypothetical protein
VLGADRAEQDILPRREGDAGLHPVWMTGA